MLRVQSELCLGCGLCAEVCPRRAISFPQGYARIDQQRCDNCRFCLEVCPQGAITEATVVGGELQATVGSLKRKVEGIMERLDYLIASRRERK